MFRIFIFGLLCVASVSLEAGTIINAGVGGNSSSDLLKRLEEDVLSKPGDIVIMMVGTNDSLNSRKLKSAAVFEEDLNSLVGQITGSGRRLVIMTLPPFVLDYLFSRHSAEAYGSIPPSERLESFNAIIRSLERGPSVLIVDIHAIFAEMGGATKEASSLIRNEANSGVKDGVHPTSEGYAVIANALHKELELAGWLEHAVEIVCFGDSITFGAGMKKAGKAEPGGTNYPGHLARLLSP
ncbi:MAG: GDSL-type esterase/lipase family protein [Verrucomicrobiales bacterium]|nr:GDSL-type esterase/lipase family protein [Verrucomicrobiales bacterium]